LGRAVALQGIKAEIARLEYQIARQTLENLELSERIAENQNNIDASYRAIKESQKQLLAMESENH
jgi:uncharacterized coiled-coil protein SlyX